ncbi:MAG: hypothetical protein GQ581_10530 [Methyloprofundus sp.]|nr:hypothetical protein [Methyloprofundus sp.]
MANPFSLPFQFNHQSISEWLGHFKSAGVIVTGQEINGVLTILNREHAKIEVPRLQLVVMRLTPAVLYLAEFLQKAIIAKPQQTKTAQMSCHILQCMAFLHGYLAKQVTDNPQKVLHANYALQITGIAFQHYAISYERPPGELWEGMSKCYQLALHANLLDVPVEKPLPGLQVVATIALALKRNLLFCLASPYRFKQQKIQQLFLFCTQNSKSVDFVQPGSSIEYVFCWDYQASSSFQPVYARPEQLPEKYVLFHAYDLLQAEQAKQHPSVEGPQLTSYFSYYEELLSRSKFSLSKPHVFVSGFAQIFEFFERHVRDYGISTANPPPSPKNLNFSNLDLTTDKAPKKQSINKVASSEIWDVSQDDTDSAKLKFGAIKLVSTAQPLFFVAEVMQLKLAVGDVFVGYDTTLKPKLGLVHCVDIKLNGKIQKSVVEICTGKVSVLSQSQSMINHQALLLEHETGMELFLAGGKYALGTILKFDEKDLVLEKVVSMSPKYMRYVVTDCS